MFNTGSYTEIITGSDVTEDVPQLDIRRLNQQSLLSPGTTLLAICGENLLYQLSIHAKKIEVTSHHQTIYLDPSPCNYGGERLWFKCPHCHQRVAVLYDVDTFFMCRTCHRLSYRSQGENVLRRSLRKIRKLRTRLDAPLDLSEYIQTKPKGMHWKTFERLRQQELDAHIRYFDALGSRFGR
jgi:hypothetical protein